MCGGMLAMGDRMCLSVAISSCRDLCPLTPLLPHSLLPQIKYIADPSMHSLPAVTSSADNKFLLMQSLDNQVSVLKGGGVGDRLIRAAGGFPCWGGVEGRRQAHRSCQVAIS